MMKVYRPLCSDVTLRLAVDISPGYDDSDEDISVNGDYEQSERVNTDRAKQLRENNQTQWNFNKSAENVLTNQTTKHHNSKSHNHSCSWYSRHNTPDKTAKDIYNHEHVADVSLDNIHNISLDSEFKRCVEEEGNDFKEDVCACDMVDNRWNRCHQGTHVGDADNENCCRLFNQYIDAELSDSLDGEARLDCETQLSHNLLAEINELSQLTDAPECVGQCSTNMQWSFKNISVDYHQGTPPQAETLEAHVPEDQKHNMLVCIDEVVSGSQEELPVDLDEDIDIIDKMVMRQSMTASCYEETDTCELVETMVQSFQAEEIPSDMSKSIAEEIHDVLLGDDEEKAEIQLTNNTGVNVLPFSYPFTLKHVGHLFEKSRHLFTISETKKRLNLPTAEESPQYHCMSKNANSTNMLACFDVPKTQVTVASKGDLMAKTCSVSTMTAVSSLEMEVTHRGLHRFIPRHKDEMNIGIGDPIHVIKECDDLWCEGINLRTGERGIFPAMYANDLQFLEESDDEDEYWKFSMRFLGSVEVASHKGDETLVQAISKVAKSHKGNVTAASLSTLEINQYGIRMIDKSKEGHEKDAFSHFFALKNISFCGTHPKDNRYFAFITKHPRDYKFACHVFHGDRPTHRARDALGEAFKRFYQEYMAFTHPTEDIYME